MHGGPRPRSLTRDGGLARPGESASLQGMPRQLDAPNSRPLAGESALRPAATSLVRGNIGASQAADPALGCPCNLVQHLHNATTLHHLSHHSRETREGRERLRAARAEVGPTVIATKSGENLAQRILTKLVARLCQIATSLVSAEEGTRTPAKNLPFNVPWGYARTGISLPAAWSGCRLPNPGNRTWVCAWPWSRQQQHSSLSPCSQTPELAMQNDAMASGGVPTKSSCTSFAFLPPGIVLCGKILAYRRPNVSPRCLSNNVTCTTHSRISNSRTYLTWKNSNTLCPLRPNFQSRTFRSMHLFELANTYSPFAKPCQSLSTGCCSSLHRWHQSCCPSTSSLQSRPSQSPFLPSIRSHYH